MDHVLQKKRHYSMEIKEKYQRMTGVNQLSEEKELQKQEKVEA